MVPTEGDEDGLRMTNLKKLGQFFSRCVIRDVAPLKKFSWADTKTEEKLKSPTTDKIPLAAFVIK